MSASKYALFICDIQQVFTKHIHGYESLVQTTNKLVKFCKQTGIPICLTTQLRGKLGDTDSRILDEIKEANVIANADKTKFSMCIPEVLNPLSKEKPKVILVGLESHVCILQTTLDLLKKGYSVQVLADGISSINKYEIPIALQRMKNEGAIISTSESTLFEIMNDAKNEGFKPMSKLVKEYKNQTKDALQILTDF